MALPIVMQLVDRKGPKILARKILWNYCELMQENLPTGQSRVGVHPEGVCPILYAEMANRNEQNTENLRQNSIGWVLHYIFSSEIAL